MNGPRSKKNRNTPVLSEAKSRIGRPWCSGIRLFASLRTGVFAHLATPVMCLLVCFATITASASAVAPPAPAPNIDIQQRLGKLTLTRHDGRTYVTVSTAQGPREITADDYLAAVAHQQRAQRQHGLLFVVFNITSWFGVVWVVVGLLGQVLFTGRMVVQWLVSEKHRRSVVPTAFWWMSLCGASMLIVYFVWRKDIVGILGQGTGWMIYIRNLWLIHRPHAETADVEYVRG